MSASAKWTRPAMPERLPPRHRPLVALGAALVVGPLALSAPATAQTATRIAENGVYQVQRPHSTAVFDAQSGSAGKTFVTWAGTDMNVHVRAWDHAGGRWETARQIRTVGTRDANAYHNYPVIVRGTDRRLHVFYALHNGELHHLRSSGPGSLDGSWTHRRVPLGGDKPGYPTAVATADGIFLFYRHGDQGTYRTLRYVRSTDHGDTWSASVTAIDTEQLQTDRLNTVYPGHIAAEPSRGRIRLMWHLAGGAYHNASTKNVYFAYMSTSSRRFSTVNGTDLGTRIGASAFAQQATNRMLAYAVAPSPNAPFAMAGRLSAVPRPAHDNRPLVTFNVNEGSGVVPMSARWNGSTWAARPIALSTGTVAGLVSDVQYSGTSTIRAIINDRAAHRLRVLRTTDDGTSWAQSWSYDARAQYLNGADTITHASSIGVMSSSVDFLVFTHREASKHSDYTGRWGVFVLGD